MRIRKTLFLLLSLFLLNIGVAMAADNALITPFIDGTRQYGAANIAGRYIVAEPVPSREAGKENLIAPTGLIITIYPNGDGGLQRAPQEGEIYGASFNFPQNNSEIKFNIELDLTAETPVLNLIQPDGGKQSNYAVLLPMGNSYIWRLVSFDSKNLSHLIPLNSDWFPDNYLEGKWHGDDGSEIIFNSGNLILNGASAAYTVSDNRLLVKYRDGKSDLIFTAYDPNVGSLVLTFNGAGQSKLAAMTYKKVQDQTTSMFPSAPTTSQTQQMPQASQAPQVVPQNPQTQIPQAPQNFPQFPQAPQQQQLFIDGVWTTHYNGAQITTQLQNNQFWDWINGQPASYGTFQIQGNIMYISGADGVSSQNVIQLDPTGQILTMRYPNGLILKFQRVR